MLSFRAQRTTERYLSCAGAHDPGFVFALRPSAKAQSAASLGELAMVLMPTNETGDLPTRIAPANVEIGGAALLALSH
jgi:hypothetical protein